MLPRDLVAVARPLDEPGWEGDSSGCREGLVGASLAIRHDMAGFDDVLRGYARRVHGCNFRRLSYRLSQLYRHAPVVGCWIRFQRLVTTSKSASKA